MYEALFHSLLSGLDPEQTHDRVLSMLQRAGRSRAALAALARSFGPRDVGLPVQLFGLTFAHPLGLAGGFDKDARAIPALAALGFSFIEVGTVTPKPQAGNPPPRLFRLPNDRALINRMGFPSAGAATVRDRLASLPRPCAVPLFVSLGKNKETPLDRAVDDYLAVLNEMHALADAFVVNISSPNTPELRRLQSAAYLGELLSEMTRATRGRAGSDRGKPLLLKISPDLDRRDLDTLMDLAIANGVSAVIATNTTTDRAGLSSKTRNEAGGLSGRPLAGRSTQMIRDIHSAAGSRLPIIGVGGVFSGRDLADKLAAGASLVQAYTGFIYRGPRFARHVLAEYRALGRNVEVGATLARALS